MVNLILKVKSCMIVVIVFMDEGKIVEQNRPEEFFGHPNNDRLKEFLSKVL